MGLPQVNGHIISCGLAGPVDCLLSEEPSLRRGNLLCESDPPHHHERLRHMDGALNNLGQDEQRLGELAQSIRQETITEELEVIMLSVTNRKTPPTNG